MNSYRHVIAQCLAQEAVVFGKGIEMVALQVEHSDHLVIKSQGMVISATRVFGRDAVKDGIAVLSLHR